MDFQTKIALTMSVIATVLSIIPIILSVYAEIRKRFALKIKIDSSESFIIEPLDEQKGNRCSVLLCVEFTNNTETPITISTVKFLKGSKKGWGVEPVDDIPKFIHNFPTGDGEEPWGKYRKPVNFPIRKEAYDYKKLYIIFPLSFCTGEKDEELVELFVYTSRGIKICAEKLSTPKGREKWFQ